MTVPLRNEVADPATRGRVVRLVEASQGDPLAPFALRPEKNYVFSPDGLAAVGYRIKVGVAVASGDPIGAVDSWPSAIQEFVIRAHAQKLKVAVLGASERAKPLWERYHLGHLAIGRDVVVKRSEFTLRGRSYRNVRQAIQRTHNSGVKVSIHVEGEMDAATIADVRAMMKRSKREDTRGFSMILGRLFDGNAPSAIIAIARDIDGNIVGAHRYLRAGQSDLSLDLPLRARGAPNGVDERLIAEVVDWSEQLGVQRVSLAFAPFPDLFANRANLSFLGRLGYFAAHLLDPMIKVEALYRYLRKFRAFDQERYVLLHWRHVVRTATAFLLLEFGA
jgi:lysylphosphatidylglycerol synthetase-like protein (DUF2156 family)